ncbi:hypothetical protein [Propionivibrio sp.]|uniref:hypothetical protein n=1 Tax=Propionivibrio sp. TaxID=2212460 RepID=UPI0025DDC663|nr:hypothetical protein [Propionivibrio sp.]MBK8746110.1 hypothetical protein [Propionivibrio sp.]
MSPLLRLLQRALAYYVLRALERQYHDQTNLLGRLHNVDTYVVYQRAWVATGKELAVAREHYRRLCSAPRRAMLA